MPSSQIILINLFTWSVYKLHNNIAVDNGLVNVLDEFLCCCVWWEPSTSVVVDEICPRTFIVYCLVSKVVRLDTGGGIYDKVARADAAICTTCTKFILNSFVDKMGQ